MQPCLHVEPVQHRAPQIAGRVLHGLLAPDVARRVRADVGRPIRWVVLRPRVVRARGVGLDRVGQDVRAGRRGALGEHQLDARQAKQRADARRHAAREKARRIQPRERQQALVARRRGRAQHPGDQREVLGERGRAGDADLQRRAQHDLGQRHQRHRRQRRGERQVLSGPEHGSPPAAAAPRRSSGPCSWGR